jgi:hypothetical protein
MPAPPPSAKPPAASTPRPRRPRLGRDDGETFGQFTPWQNPAAAYAYYVGLAGLTPVLGAVLGAAAVVLGVVGTIRSRRPEVGGANFAIAGLVLGTLEVLFNAAGIGCLGRGMEWW